MLAQKRPHSICLRLTCYIQKICLINRSDHEYIIQLLTIEALDMM